MLSTTFSLKAHDNDNSGCCFIGEDAEVQTVGDTAGGEAGFKDSSRVKVHNLSTGHAASQASRCS